MKCEKLSDEEIIRRLAKTDYWEKGTIHPSINRLYVDVECLIDCEQNDMSDFGFCYCEDCKDNRVVCIHYKQTLHKFGKKGMI